mmetsp:Transcript_62200/g.163357  ORF Transcript_62200/g.163357 Transcript_62200/m.163357 type:complete len:320 (+) Transcript_62200:167-1126(+)
MVGQQRDVGRAQARRRGGPRDVQAAAGAGAGGHAPGKAKADVDLEGDNVLPGGPRFQLGRRLLLPNDHLVQRLCDHRWSAPVWGHGDSGPLCRGARHCDRLAAIPRDLHAGYVLPQLCYLLLQLEQPHRPSIGLPPHLHPPDPLRPNGRGAQELGLVLPHLHLADHQVPATDAALPEDADPQGGLHELPGGSAGAAVHHGGHGVRLHVLAVPGGAAREHREPVRGGMADPLHDGNGRVRRHRSDNARRARAHVSAHGRQPPVHGDAVRYHRLLLHQHLGEPHADPPAPGDARSPGQVGLRRLRDPAALQAVRHRRRRRD